jgi:sugar O-acyltransferase (sialic acid O-acetyltransferase NeuD family)
MTRLAIIGSGDLGLQIAYHAIACGYKVIGFFDDYANPGSSKSGLPVLGKVENVVSVFEQGVFDSLMIGIGYKHLQARGVIFNKFKGKIPYATLIHPSSYVDPNCRIGEGSFIYPGCKLDMNVVLGDNVLLNIGCVIAHDSVIGENSFLGPSVSVAGFVTVENSVNLGIGTVVIDNVRIAAGVRTGGGAVVVDTLIEPGLYAGVPAKMKKSNNG